MVTKKANNTKYPSDEGGNRINIYVGEDAAAVDDVREKVGNLSRWFREKIHEELKDGDSKSEGRHEGS